MKGFITKTAAGLCLSITLSALGGCGHYRNLVDPCWPDRYSAMAAMSVRDMHNAQAGKGHLLEQTVWNWHFDADPKTGDAGDRLNGAGLEHLRRIARSQPMPDFHLWLQNAQDVPYTGGAPDKVVVARENLNSRRIAAIQRFLATEANGANFQVSVHNFAPTGIPAELISGTAPQPSGIYGGYQKLQNNFQGAAPSPGSSSTGGSSSSNNSNSNSGSTSSGSSGGR